MSTATAPAAGDVRLFADPLRLRIVSLLAAEELCTCHLVAMTGAKQPTVSHHLRVLRDAGVVDTEPVGAFTYYRLRPQRLAQLADGFATLAEQARRPRSRRPACE